MHAYGSLCLRLSAHLNAIGGGILSVASAVSSLACTFLTQSCLRSLLCKREAPKRYFFPLAMEERELDKANLSLISGPCMAKACPNDRSDLGPSTMIAPCCCEAINCIQAPCDALQAIRNAAAKPRPIILARFRFEACGVSISFTLVRLSLPSKSSCKQTACTIFCIFCGD